MDSDEDIPGMNDARVEKGDDGGETPSPRPASTGPGGPERLVRALVAGVLLVALYVLVARLSLLLAFEGTNASPVWPPSGLAVAVLVLLGTGNWPVIAVGAFVTNLLFLLQTQGVALAPALAISAAIGLGNAAEAALGSMLVRRASRASSVLERAHGALQLVGIALLVCLVAAGIGPLTSCLAGLIPWSLYPTTAFTWWLGDVAGVLIVAPFVVAWLSPRGRDTGMRRALWIEAGALLTAQVGFALFLFTSEQTGELGHKLDYLAIPWLLWAAVRFEARIWTLAIVLLAIIAIWGTARGAGALSASELNTSLLFLQMFVCVVTTVIIVLGATVAERRAAERALAATAQKLQASNTELEQFAHTVSHDLKAPLRGINQLATWIRQDCGDVLGEEAKEHLVLLSGRAARMSALIDGILAYSRAGRSDMPLAPVDTDAVAREVLSMLELPPGFTVRIDGHLPTVPHARTHMTQILQNLIDNAIVHHGRPPGQVVLSCTETPDAWCFAVRDDGVGIPARDHQRIFQLFQTMAPPGQEGGSSGGGSGIGLAVVKRLVERHGGRVWVDSTEGQGTTMFFTVPRHPPDPE